MWFIFFDILWLIICDIEICFSFEWLFVMQLLVSSEFYIKNIYLFWFFIIHINLVNTIFFFFFILIKSNKQVNTTDPFNKWVMLGLKNPDPFNKHVGLVLTHMSEFMSWHNMNPTRKYELPPLMNMLRVTMPKREG